MMVEENKSLIEQYSELEQSLKKAKEEIGYYKNIEVETGRIRLREIDKLSRLITERKKAEKALREGEELLRATVESTADGILVVDEKGQVTHTNKRFAQMWHIPDELIRIREDKKLLDFVLGQLKEPEVFLSKVQVLYKTSDEDFDVLDFIDGRVFERFSSPLIRDGQIAGRVWSFRDITDRKRAERALRESEGKFRFLAEKMVDIVWTINRNFQTTYVSPSIENVLGFTPEERKQQSLEEMITPESLQKVQIMFLEELQRDKQDTADPDRSITVEVEYYQKDGSTVWMENIVKAIRDSGGEFVGMHGVSRDITDRKEMEEKLLKAHEKLERRVEERTAELVAANAQLKQDAIEREIAQKELKKREQKLELQTRKLEEINTALKVILEKRNEDKVEIEEKVRLNINEMILPYLEKLRKSLLNELQQSYVDILESNLNEITSPFYQRMASNFYHLTPKEIQIAGLIKQGKTTKEIAELLQSSPRAIEFHRNNLRKKFGLTNTKINLITHLLTLN
jgi:PAS domain S-box-containing protein